MNIEDVPLEERRKRAGEELANTLGEPSALRIFLVMKAWRVDEIIWPENMSSNLKASRTAGRMRND